MTYKQLKKREEGFTIIEVLIVLAIAGLIMLIVFLAVPALQRNSRNTQRTNDASTITAAISECMANTNGSVSTCIPASPAAPGGTYFDSAKVQQLTTRGSVSGTNVNNYEVTVSNGCNPTGTALQAGGGSRAFAITYNIETTGTPQLKCLSS